MSRSPLALPARHTAADAVALREQQARTRPPQARPAPPQALSPAALLQALGTGRPLEPQVRADMESRFGADFGDVRVHDCAAAHALARSQSARAFTLGNQIAFDRSRYAPASDAGRRLLAHELAHVVQQRRGGCDHPVAGGALEQAAEHAAAQAVSAPGPVRVAGASAVAVARQPAPGNAGQDLPAPPRSLSGSLARDHLSDRELDLELTLMEAWLVDVRQDPNRAFLVSEYKALWFERSARRARQQASGPKRPPPDSGTTQALLGIVESGIDQSVEIQEAHRAWLATGEILQTRTPYSHHEIKTGQPMSRAKRYDAMAARLGMDWPLEEDVRTDVRDPDFLTREEYQTEFKARVEKEKDDCDDEYFWPKYERACKRDVDAKYGGPAFVAWRASEEAKLRQRIMEVSEKIANVRDSGAMSLAGRVAGYGLGAATGHDALRWSEWGATLAGPLDVAVPSYIGYRQWSQMQSYGGSSGLEVRRDAPVTLFDPGPRTPVPTPTATPFEGLSSAPARTGAVAQALRLGPPAPQSLGTGPGAKAQSTPPPTPAGATETSAAEATSAATVAPKPSTAAKPAKAKPAPPTGSQQSRTTRPPSASKQAKKPRPVGAKQDPVATPAPSAADPAATAPVATKAPAKRQASTTSRPAPGGAPAQAPARGSRPRPLTAEALNKRLAALQAPEHQLAEFAEFAAACNAVRQLRRTSPAKAEALLSLLEEKFPPPSRSAEVQQLFQEQQDTDRTDKDARNVNRQQTARSDRQQREQREPGRKDVLKATIRDSAELGVLGGREQAAREQIKVRNWDSAQKYKGDYGRGPDDLGKSGKKELLLEYKGGGSPLDRNGDIVEMSNAWAGRKIAEIEKVGDKATARRLLAALDNNDLQGVVYRTRGPIGQETTVREPADKLRRALQNEQVTDDGLILYDPQKVRAAYEAHRDRLQTGIEKRDKRAIKNL